MVIADTGCRNAVAGEAWHERCQIFLKEKGITWQQAPERETYQFGSGAPEISQVAYLYPVLLEGSYDVVRISCVGGGAVNCPGLIGPSELSRWGVIFNFEDRSIQIRGCTKPTELTSTRHPAIAPFDFPVGDPWIQPGMPGKLQLLIRSPQSLAFVAGQAREEGQDMNRSQEDGSEGEVSDEDPEPCWLKNEQARRNRERHRDWLQMLQNDLGVKVIQDLPDATSTASELEYDLKEEDEVSITSHEFGVEPDTDADVQSSDGEGRSSEEELLKGEDYPGRRHTYFRSPCARRSTGLNVWFRRWLLPHF